MTDTTTDTTAEEAARIGGGTANRYLAELLNNALQQARAGYPLTALDLAAINEAADRIEESGHANDDCGDYFGPGAEADARAAGYTVSERTPGAWVYSDPDADEDEETHDTEESAWEAAAADYALSDREA